MSDKVRQSPIAHRLVFSAGLGGRLVVGERSVAAWRGRFERGMELDDNERWKWTYVDQTRARTANPSRRDLRTRCGGARNERGNM